MEGDEQSAGDRLRGTQHGGVLVSIPEIAVAGSPGTRAWALQRLREYLRQR
jgi:hypothetical protein